MSTGLECQSAFKFDPPSASKNDPPEVIFFSQAASSGTLSELKPKAKPTKGKAVKKTLLKKVAVDGYANLKLTPQ